MSVRSYTKMWLHLVWSTHKREKSLLGKEIRKRISTHLTEYSKSKGIYMKVNYVNIDHVHALIDLPTNLTIEEVMRLLKGESSSWINKQSKLKFAWGKGYGAFSVSESNIRKVVNYINNQDEHHRKKPFSEEYSDFLKAYKIDVDL